MLIISVFYLHVKNIKKARDKRDVAGSVNCQYEVIIYFAGWVGVAAGVAAGALAGAGAAWVVCGAAGAMAERLVGVLMAKLAQMLATQMNIARPHVVFSIKSVVLR